MRDGKGPLFTAYVAFTTLVGTAVLVLLFVGEQPGTGGFGNGIFWVLTAMAVAAELLPLTVPRGEREGELTVSTTCGLALLFVLGPAAAAIALALASLVADVSHRKSPWKLVFNAAHYVLSVAAASIVISATGTWYGGSGSLSAIDVVVALVAGAMFAAVNSLVMAGAVSVATRSGPSGSSPVPLTDILRGDASFLAWSYTVLVCLAPIVALTATASPWAVPLFIVPAVAVYQSVSIYLDRKRFSLHDALTGLPNRALFEDRVTQAVAGAQRTGTKAAVLMLDIDQFKEVNSTLGFEIGDRLLRDLASRLESQVREVDTIARLGADEFGVVLVGISEIAAAESVVAALREAITRPFVVGDTTLAVEASVGGALCPDDGVQAIPLISAADDAMGEAKRLRFGHRWHAAAQQGQVAGRMRLLAELGAALDAEDLELHYQPKASLRTGEISGVEALVRWRRKGAELVAPSEFIPVAEQTGLMATLTRYVLTHAIAQMRSWHDAGQHIRVAVNISARDLQDDELTDDIARMLSTQGVDATDLELEITESSIMADIEQAVKTLSRLHDMGITLAIDDFGTGNTSLAQLPRLPVDVLKIDRSFVARLDYGPDDLIVRTTIELGRGLGLKVVAEGVASNKVWQRLGELGCDYAQGYYLSRPVPAGDVELLIGRHAV